MAVVYGLAVKIHLISESYIRFLIKCETALTNERSDGQKSRLTAMRVTQSPVNSNTFAKYGYWLILLFYI